MDNFQFSLFGFQKPKAKVPISKQRILEAKEQLKKMDSKGLIKTLRDVRDSLERKLG
jgi:molecular chaperone GrpE (heat shock protein)